METEPTFVIVGAMLAGVKTAEALRNEGFEGRIVLIGDEAERPYNRPPLSKDYLQRKIEKDKIYVHPESWYAQNNVDLRRESRVSKIDPARHRVSVEGGEVIRYDKLLLATGSSPRLLSLPGAEYERVFTLRRVEDCERLKTAFASASRVAIIGAGWIGLEVAAAARAAKVDVTVLARGELPLLKVLGPETAEVFADLHTRHGVDFRFGVQVTEITGDDVGRATGVRLADGTQVDADMVVVGVGATPNIQLAEAAGLTVDNGVQVDEHLRSSDPDIYAAGDVANQFHPVLGTHIRIEHWANALNQPVVAAKSMLGVDAAYDTLPYFYSDQYELGMEYSGYVGDGGYDEVVFRGDVDALEFIVFWMKDRRVLAGMNVNIWDETDRIRALIESGRQFDRDALADTGTALEDILTTAR